ncbi:MAG: hypothetical protein E7643_08140 [Ruminococcaceae bacterium]|nr:hypothetical protein [Oscillospiraceae bacterium]
MKNGNGWRGKLARRSASTAITVCVVALVLVLNIVFGALSSGNLWYIDLTPEGGYNVYTETSATRKHVRMYTLMDETVDFVSYVIDEANSRRKEDDPVKVDIIFCAEPDILKRSDAMRYVYYTALNLQKEFPETISVSCKDVWSNPSSVDMYRSTAYASIYQSNIIVASGSEFRITSLNSYYTYDSESNTGTPVAYNGQKIFAQQILDVTGAEAPICCLTTNHGEVFGRPEYAPDNRENWPEYKEFVKVLEGAGYEIRYLDLEKDEIPENCRLILCFDPTKDFVSSYTGGETKKESEILRLDAFLEKSYSFMVFTDADTPELPNLEEYLEFWGIEMMHYDGKDGEGNEVEASYRVEDYDNRLDATGSVFTGEYAKGKGLGTAVISDLISSSAMPQIVFGNARPLLFSDTFESRYVMGDESTGTEAYSYVYNEKDGGVRAAFDMFSAGTSEAPAIAYATAGGRDLADSEGNPIGVGSGIYKVMTLSAESRRESEGMGYSNVDRTSYVCVVGSTDMVKDEILGTTSYGNTDVLLSTLRYIGKDVNPVGLQFVPMHDPAMDLTVSDAAGNETALFTEKQLTDTAFALVLIPAIIIAGACAVVLIRRRARS